MYRTEPPTDKKFVCGILNSSRVAACALRNEEAGRGHRRRLSSVCEKRLSGALRSHHIEHPLCLEVNAIGIKLQ